jgi:hypothetical protein
MQESDDAASYFLRKKELMMKSSASFFVSRRAMLSALTALPALVTLSPAGASVQTTAANSSLPSWNDAQSKNAIVAFIQRVTKQGSPEFVPEAERIATFDNDGTLWAELPMYLQLLFALHRVRVIASQYPERETKARLLPRCRRTTRRTHSPAMNRPTSRL